MRDRPSVSGILRVTRRKGGVAVAVTLLAVAVLASAVAAPLPRLVWNISASAPIGLYLVEPGRHLRLGEQAVARIPEPFLTLAARRHYLPSNVPLVKSVAAGPGDRVCASGSRVFVNGRVVAHRLDRDRAGREMPWWSGCVRLPEDSVFLLMAGQPGSFDGRYFGPTHAGLILGRATLLWAR